MEVGLKEYYGTHAGSPQHFLRNQDGGGGSWGGSDACKASSRALITCRPDRLVEVGLKEYYGTHAGSPLPREMLREHLSEATAPGALRRTLDLRGNRLCSVRLQVDPFSLPLPLFGCSARVMVLTMGVVYAIEDLVWPSPPPSKVAPAGGGGTSSGLQPPYCNGTCGEVGPRNPQPQ